LRLEPKPLTTAMIAVAPDSSFKKRAKSLDI
jgi:hypothetical protein